jgi:hypothetical protein
MSTIAVFVAVGGTSKPDARDSIEHAQLKRNAVTSVKAGHRSLRRGDLANARVGSREPRGPRGPTGPSESAPAPEAWKPLPLRSGRGNYGASHVAGATVGGGEPQPTARLGLGADGQLIWFTGYAPESATDTSLDRVACWPA